MTSETGQGAINYVRKGLHITLCVDKDPKWSGKDWGLKTWIEKDIEYVFSVNPSLNVGMIMGPINGMIDIEADSPEQEQAFAELFANCDIPKTPTFQSSRGLHRLFAWDSRLPSAGVVSIRGLGIRIGNAAQVHSIVPPSVGRVWTISLDDCAPAPLPDVVIDRIIAASTQNKSTTNTNGENADDLIVAGRRNDTLYRFACNLRRSGKSVSEIETELADENMRRCSPPLPFEELSKIAKSAGRYMPSAAIAQSENRTETENARRFAREHGERARYVEEWGQWIVFTGKRWEPDPERIRVEKLAKQTSDSIWDDVLSVLQGADQRTVTSLTGWHKHSASRRGVSNMLSLAQSEDGVVISHRQLDSHPRLLNVRNGSLDLETGILRPHDRNDFLTKISPVEFDADAYCPQWRRFLKKIMAENEELIEFLQRLAGYWLTGDVSEHVLPILFGSGANGKSVFLNTLQSLLGPDYAMKCSHEMLLAHSQPKHSTDLTDLFGKRLACSIELEAGRRLNEALVKELTGGDEIRARRMKQDNWQWSPTHKLVVAANHRPVIKGADDGIWRRLRLVPFTVVIPHDQQDKDLTRKLRGELPGILNWALRGCQKWIASQSLGEPTQVTTATADYREDSDLLAQFLKEKCVVCESSQVVASKLYEHYKEWCSENGLEADSNTAFGRKLTERGFQVARRAEGKVRMGIGVTQNPKDEDV